MKINFFIILYFAFGCGPRACSYNREKNNEWKSIDSLLNNSSSKKEVKKKEKKKTSENKSPGLLILSDLNYVHIKLFLVLRNKILLE